MSDDRDAAAAGAAFAAHSAAHRVIDDYLDALFAVLDQGLATLALAMQLRRALLVHLDFEERVVLPRCRGAAADAVSNVRRDHRLIRHGFDRLEEAALLRAFERVDARVLRHTLVHLERLLDHHDDRETGQLYGPLAEGLEPAARAELDALFAGVAPPMPSVDNCRAIAAHPVVVALADRYRAWLAGAALREVPLAGADLPLRAREALPKLLRRDDHVVRRQRALATAPPRAHAAGDMLAEVSLRSTLTFVLEALLDAADQGR